MSTREQGKWIGIVVITAIVMITISYHKIFGFGSASPRTLGSGNLGYYRQMSSGTMGVPVTIEITKTLSEPVIINKSGSPHSFKLIAGAVEDNVPYNVFHKGRSSNWTEPVPAYNDWERLGFKPKNSKVRAESVRFALPPNAPMSRAFLYYTIVPVK